MIRCLSVYTYEVDDPEVAFNEIKMQIDEKMLLLENSVGVIMCHTEFILTGVLQYICENLPFELAGVTTASQAVNGEAGELMLSIFVMTSDDVRFKTGVTENLDDDIAEPTRAAYNQTAGGVIEPVKLVLVFPPLILKYAGDRYVHAWNEIIPQAPLFGTIAVDDTISFEGSETIYNGISYKSAMAFILCYGNIHPRFLMDFLSEDSKIPYKGEITKAEGPLVYEINNMNAYQYFKELGFANGATPFDNFLFVPFIIDLKKRADYDGIPVMRVLTSFTENGTAIFRGNVDENSEFNLSKCTLDDVMLTAERQIRRINAMSGINGALSFSCIIRRMVLGIDPLLELETFKKKMNPDTPFMTGYAGGEICPTSIRNGVPTNRFHNYSLITLVV